MPVFASCQDRHCRVMIDSIISEFKSEENAMKTFRFVPLFFFFVLSAVSQPSDSPRQNGFIPAQNAQLYYEIMGSGEPVVILHGGPGLDHTYLLPQFEALSKHYKLILYDQRSSGKSTGVVDSIHITPQQFVEDLEAVRKYFNLDKMNLIGHSWGGFLAMEYAIKYPERIKTLILVSSLGANSDCIAPFMKNREERTTHADSVALANVLSSDAFAKREPKVVAEFTRISFAVYFYDRSREDSLTLNFNQETANNFLPIYGLMSKYFGHYDVYAQLTVIHSPVLILHGDYDPIPSKFSEQLTKYLQNSKFVLLKNCGHFPFVETPVELFGECEKFLGPTR